MRSIPPIYTRRIFLLSTFVPLFSPGTRPIVILLFLFFATKQIVLSPPISKGMRRCFFAASCYRKILPLSALQVIIRPSDLQEGERIRKPQQNRDADEFHVVNASVNFSEIGVKGIESGVVYAF